MVLDRPAPAPPGETGVKFTVQWSRRALDAVAQLWLDNPDGRAEITNATTATDQLLKFDPGEKGESRGGDRRILFVPPLVVIFRVDSNTTTVRVLDARHLRRRSTGE
jgi:hypothetical protein